MKNNYLLFSMLLSIFIISCTDTDENQLEIEGIVHSNYSEQEVLKSFTVFDKDRLNSVKIEIYNSNYINLTVSDFKIKGYYDSKLEISKTSDGLSVSDESLDHSLSDFNLTELNLGEGVNALQIDLLKELDLRGEDPLYWESTVVCLNGTRIAGFNGNPLNCNHTDWEWKYRKVVNNWFDKWVKVYDADSYGSSTTIQYFNPSINAPKYQLRIDPNSNCNAYSTFSILSTSGC